MKLDGNLYSISFSHSFKNFDDDKVSYKPSVSSIPMEEPKTLRQSLKRRIIAAYVDGFDIIKLKAEERLTEEQQDIIREAIEDLFVQQRP